jgi:hypothetical protein
MKKRTCFIGLIALVYFLLGLGSPAFAEGLGLVELLVKNLGITTYFGLFEIQGRGDRL